MWSCCNVLTHSEQRSNTTAPNHLKPLSELLGLQLATFLPGSKWLCRTDQPTDRFSFSEEDKAIGKSACVQGVLELASIRYTCSSCNSCPLKLPYPTPAPSSRDWAAEWCEWVKQLTR